MNALFRIQAYQFKGGWVFDDESRGLKEEPFVIGADTWLQRTYEERGLADGKVNFVFSPTPLPQYTDKLTMQSTDIYAGSWYFTEKYQERLWLCPALFKFFPEAPKEIYVLVS